MKDNCEDEFHLRLRDVFSKVILGAWSPVYMQTHAQAHTRKDTDACMDEETR